MVGAPDTSPDALAAETTRPQLRQAPAPARSTLADWVTPDPASANARGQGGQAAPKRVRVSLRLDQDRHTRLKLVATQRNCTLQSLFNEAIDEFFIRHAPDLHGISAHFRKGAAATGTAATAASDRKIKRGKRRSEGQNGPS
jgi:predicted DNA-binding ribbon-helix-helix protein